MRRKQTDDAAHHPGRGAPALHSDCLKSESPGELSELCCVVDCQDCQVQAVTDQPAAGPRDCLGLSPRTSATSGARRKPESFRA